MAGVFWNRLSASVDGVLLSHQDDQLQAVPARSDKEAGPVRLGDKVLLEIADRDLWRLVSLRLCQFPRTQRRNSLL